MASTPPEGSETKDLSLPFPLQQGERVLQISRRHWWYLWPSLISQTLAAVVPVLALWWLFDVAGANEGVGGKALWLISLLWLVYWGVRLFLAWYRYHHDIWVITNQRLVDSYKKNPFNLRVSSADLVNVQDISVERLGILQTALNFGDIVCQTSSAREVFRLTGLPDPRAVQALIDQERDRERLRVRGI